MNTGNIQRKDKHNMSGNDPLDLKGKGWDGEYVGNIWGWRFSLLSLGIIVFVGGLMAFRYWQVNSAIPTTHRDTIEAPADSTAFQKGEISQ